MGKKRKEEYEEEYEEGYKAAENDFLDENKLKLFEEGFKAGYRDGYNAAVEDTKQLLYLNVPNEIREQIEEGAQPGWRVW